MPHQTSWWLGLPLAAASLVAVPGFAAAPDTPIGTWIDHSGQGAIEIKDCGGSLCGKVVWLKSPKHASRCNLSILGDLSSTGQGAWGGGWIFDPEAKSKFDVEITPLENGKLKVLGYAGNKLFSRTMTWTRAPGDLRRCDEPAPPVETARATQAAGGGAALPVPAAVKPPQPGAQTTPPAATDNGGARAGHSEQPAGAAEVASKPEITSSAPRRSAKPSKSRGTETVRLAELRGYGLQDVTLRKTRGSCSLKISDFGNVAFPC